MSPIFVRPVREQLEHDRLIRHLALKYKRKFEVTPNIGDEQAAPVKVGAATLFPDLVLISNHKTVGLVEVETGESVNNLEAMAQWTHFSRARVPFYLYVPVNAYDAAKRLCDGLHVKAAEIWTYRPALEGFDLVRMFVDASTARTSAGTTASGGKTARRADARSKSAKPSRAAATTARAKPGRKAGSAAKPSRKGKVAKSARSKPTSARAGQGRKSTSTRTRTAARTRKGR